MRELSLALAVPRWAGRFYLRNWQWIVGLSLIASVQRLVVVQWTEQVPQALAVASEVLVAGVRILLVVLIWRAATRGERLRWVDARAFATGHWQSLLWQGVLLTAAFLVFDIGMESVAALLPETWQQTYLAVLLFAKNPTVIAFTMVWWVGLVRQAAISRPVPAERARSRSSDPR